MLFVVSHLSTMITRWPASVHTAVVASVDCRIRQLMSDCYDINCATKMQGHQNDGWMVRVLQYCMQAAIISCLK